MRLTRAEMHHAERNERNLLLAHNLAKKVFAEPEAFPENLVVVEIESGVVERLFTRNRVELIHTLRHDGPAASVDQLAARVDRPPEDIERDLFELELVGLVDQEHIGSRMRIRAPDCPVIIV